MKIYAPVKDFNGVRNNVRFVRGVGETEDQAAIDWFMSRGYTVEKSQKSYEKCVEMSEKPYEKCDEQSLRVEQAATIQPEVVVEDAETANQPDFESMTPNELRDWMKSNGYGSVIKNTRNKEKLLEIIRG